MIRFKTGAIVAEDAEALVNTVNCVGAMGRGVALQFKWAFPENFRAYVEACNRCEVQPGHMFVFETGVLDNPRYIINFPTKRHWRGSSRVEDIQVGLNALAQLIRERGIRSIAVPALGCGLGGLEWPAARLLRNRLVAAMICRPSFSSLGCLLQTGLLAHPQVPTMNSGRAALVGLMHRYLHGLLDPFVTLLEVHKLLYFMQTEGEPLRLRFR